MLYDYTEKARPKMSFKSDRSVTAFVYSTQSAISGQCSLSRSLL